MAGQIWLIADRPQAVVAQGQPPVQQAAWLLDIPDGSNALETAAEFAKDSGFPLGTVVRVVDPSKITDASALQKFRLDSQWVSV